MGKIDFKAVPHVSQAQLDRNRVYNRSLNYPSIEVGKVGAASPKLAVVGGSPSVINYLDELRSWDGDIFAVNRTWRLLRDNGIESTFYTIDPITGPIDGIKKAVLADTVSRKLIDGICGAEIEIIYTGIDDILHFTTSAATVPMFACWRGHKKVTFFGCDSSYTDVTHADRDDSKSVNFILVKCGEKVFKTSPQMLMQAESMAETIRKFPSYLENRGDGLLGALIKNGDYDITHISPGIERALKNVENLQC